MVDVAAWLGGLGLAKYAQAFADHEIDGDALRHLTDEDLRELGLPVGPRRKVLAALGDLATSPAPDGAAPEARTLAAQAERRQLTVMFVDLVGSTELSLKLDPEELRDLSRGYGDAVSREVGRYGGHVAKYMGDGVLVYFGYPQAHEDDAVRAIYAGLAVTRAVKRLGRRMLEAHGGRLRARVGIATGMVVIGDLIGAEGSEAEAVTGETPNLAYRLQDAAGSGRVAVAERTRLLAGEAFTYEEPEERKLKGFPDAVRLWRVLGPSGAESRFEALHGRWLTPLVGREHEIALLMDRWEQAKEGEGQVVLISGEPGIGKSRITEVLRERIMADDHLRVRFQCSPYHTNSALYPVIEHLERAAGFERDEAAEAKLVKLEALIGQAGVNEAEFAPLLAALLSIPTGERYPPLVMSPERRKERTLAALSDQVGGLAAAKPLLMIVEDAHWIDPTTLESIDLTIARAEAQRLLVVVTYRPEFQAQWVGRPNVTLITMNRLSRRHGAAMIEGIAGGRALPLEILDQVVAKTDGVPLFVEELTRMVLESGLLREDGGRYVLDGPLPPLAIPATLHDSLMARLDRLAPAKEVAQTAAAIGRTFSHELLAAVVAMDPPKLDAALDQLVDAGLAFRQGTGTEASYTFKHALVQDAAYASMLKSQRQRLHAHIAGVLESTFPAQADAAPEVLAQHYHQAGLNEQAITWWAKAGQRASARSANIEAIASFERALALIDSMDEIGQLSLTALQVATGLGSSRMAVLGFGNEQTGLAYRRARELCENVDDPPRVFPVLYGSWLNAYVGGRFAESWSAAETFSRLAEKHQDPGALCAKHTIWGQEFFARGNVGKSIASFRQSAALGEPERDHSLAFSHGEHPTATSLSMMGWALWGAGFPDEALRRCDEGIVIARESDHVHSIAQNLTWRSYVLVLRGEFEQAIDGAGTAAAYSASNGLDLWKITGEMTRSWAIANLGKDTSTVATLWQLRAAFRALGSGAYDWIFTTPCLEACLIYDRFDEPLALIDEVLNDAMARGELMGIPEIRRLRGELIRQRSTADIGHAEQEFTQALALAREQEARSYELRAAMSLARLWAERGERQRACDLLAPIYASFTEGFDTRDLIEAKALLEGLS